MVNKSKEFENYEDNYWNRVMAVVNRNLDNPDFKQNTLIREVGTSHATLYRILKYRTGKTFPAFVQQLRLEKACLLLQKQKEMNMQEVANSVGFYDYRYFGRCFKQMYGLTPSDYQRSLGKNKDL